MSKSTLQDSFLEFCRKQKFEINSEQVKIVSLLDKFVNPKKNFLNILLNSKDKLCFYLYGNVGVGKTMILDFIYNKIKIKKLRLHYNEFMINFHDFRHEKKNNNSINAFVKNLKKKYEFIYLDEFQVTNIVDAMILGKLFEVIFSENIKIIITTNTKLDNLYKDGLQREQFLPFISTIKKYSMQKELLLKEDYRQQNQEQLKRIFYPLNEKTSFKINKNFHELTKGKRKEEKIIKTKGRNFEIKNFFNGVSRFKFNELCDAYLGAEDYINIAEISNHVFIEEVPNFNDENSNQQQRFITLIDIFYEKKIALTLSVEKNIVNLTSSNKHLKAFKRTLSRLHEMTKIY
jgi:cell division protein ZapE